ARHIAVTTNGTDVIFIVTNLPTTCPLQRTLAGGRDAFLSKLNSNGTAFVYSTYFGGSAHDSAPGVAIDSPGNAYMTGWTESTALPVTTNVFQSGATVGTQSGSTPSGRSPREGFVTKFDPAGALLYSTYLGGAGDDIPTRIAVDGAGSAYVTGDKNSSDFPS